MKKRKENMTPDYRKSGYLKVGRSVLRAFFMGERDLRELASVLLCVETFAYFSEGQVWLNDQVYFCHPGEWITSYTEIEELTGIDRRQVKKYLVKLEKQHFVFVSNVGFTSGLRWSIMNNPYRCNMGNRWHIIRTEPTGMIPAVASGMKR